MDLTPLRRTLQFSRGGEEGDRSMFSDDVELESRAHWPKNGPVPAHPVNGYAETCKFAALNDNR
jgi:hypothetical protein